MFKLKPLNKKGFGHVEMIVFAVVILAIGCIGYFALKSSNAATPPKIAVRVCYADLSPPMMWKTNGNWFFGYKSGPFVKQMTIMWGDGKQSFINQPPRSGSQGHSYPFITSDTKRTIKVYVYCGPSENSYSEVSFIQPKSN